MKNRSIVFTWGVLFISSIVISYALILERIFFNKLFDLNLVLITSGFMMFSSICLFIFRKMFSGYEKIGKIFSIIAICAAVPFLLIGGLLSFSIFIDEPQISKEYQQVFLVGILWFFSGFSLIVAEFIIETSETPTIHLS